MRLPGAMIAAAAALLSSYAAHAADDQKLTGREVLELLQGNTLTGRYSNGSPYSEYHAPDGRVFGHNNRRPVVNGCWQMKGDLACYYYAEDRQRGPFCWTFTRLGENAFRAKFVDHDGWEIVGLLQKGNPHGHSDNGKPWTCDPLLSGVNSRERFAYRSAR